MRRPIASRARALSVAFALSSDIGAPCYVFRLPANGRFFVSDEPTHVDGAATLHPIAEVSALFLRVR